MDARRGVCGLEVLIPFFLLLYAKYSYLFFSRKFKKPPLRNLSLWRVNTLCSAAGVMMLISSLLSFVFLNHNNNNNNNSRHRRESGINN